MYDLTYIRNSRDPFGSLRFQLFLLQSFLLLLDPSLTDLSKHLDITLVLDIISCWILDIEPG